MLQQDVEVLATIGLAGRGVPVAILGVVLGHALEDQAQPAGGLADRQGSRGEIRQEPLRPDRAGRLHRQLGGRPLHEPLEVLPHAAPQDSTQRPRCQQVLRKQARAIALDKLAGRGEGLVVAHPLEHRKPQLPRVGHPGLEEPGHQKREPVEDPLGDVRSRRLAGPG